MWPGIVDDWWVNVVAVSHYPAMLGMKMVWRSGTVEAGAWTGAGNILTTRAQSHWVRERNTNLQPPPAPGWWYYYSRLMCVVTLLLLNKIWQRLIVHVHNNIIHFIVNVAVGTGYEWWRIITHMTSEVEICWSEMLKLWASSVFWKGCQLCKLSETSKQKQFSRWWC